MTGSSECTFPECIYSSPMVPSMLNMTDTNAAQNPFSNGSNGGS